MSHEDLKEALKNRTGRIVVCRTLSQAISNDAQTAAAIAAAERAERAAGGGYSALLFTPEYTRKMLESGQQDHAAAEMAISVDQARELLSLGAEWNDLESLRP
jgi:hypothetical protein